MEGKFIVLLKIVSRIYIIVLEMCAKSITSTNYFLLGFDDISPGDVDKFSKSYSGRRHAIGDTEDNSFPLIEGLFDNQINDGNILSPK